MSNQIHTINELFKIYRERVMPPAPELADNQLKETKRAFFGGAHIMFVLMTEQIGALSEQDALRAMMSLAKQFEGFCEAVKLGEA